MIRIFYITKPFSVLAGGLLRKRQIELLESNSYQVHVVFLSESQGKGRFNLLFQKLLLKTCILAQHIGIFDDYLDPWVKSSFVKLSKIINKDDIIFSTGSGELGCYKLGHLLSKHFGCRHVANLHDPATYTYVNGQRFLTPFFHVKRDRKEYMYFSSCDLLITSSKKYMMNLRNKYPSLALKLHNSYFGYLQRSLSTSSSLNSKVRIVYSGTFDSVQSPEILISLAMKFESVEIHFLGKYSEYKPLKNISIANVFFHDFLPHGEFMEFMLTMDVGFVSLKGDYYENCFPSKIFEYVNLGLPILGILPDSDARDFVNDNGFGLIVKDFDQEILIDNIIKVNFFGALQLFKKRILEERDLYSMEVQFKNVLDLLK